jgi:hypothetical protein
MTCIMPTAWLYGPYILSALSLIFALHTRHLGADLGAAMGVCFAGNLLWPRLARKRAHPPLSRDRTLRAWPEGVRLLGMLTAPAPLARGFVVGAALRWAGAMPSDRAIAFARGRFAPRAGVRAHTPGIGRC